MPRPQQTASEINRVIFYLVNLGLADDQNLAFQRDIGAGQTEVSFKGAEHLSRALKDWAYVDLYDALRAERAYTVLLPDGALLQFNYLFVDGELQKHRLAFWPSPHLERFQNDPETYLEEAIYADVVAKRVVPFPVRFDHDARTGIHQDIRHPVSHLTLGQYENCRIPLTAPLPPAHFADFILRNFYHTAFYDFASGLPRFPSSYDECISHNEREVVHIVIPRALHQPNG